MEVYSFPSDEAIQQETGPNSGIKICADTTRVLQECKNDITKVQSGKSTLSSHFSVLSAPIIFLETGVGVLRPAPLVGLFL